ncbi:hypothetical protein [Halalkalibacillus halophilus]|uniref:hypothetical protein n=1 Tax=Halalkalibacillus halophilus TaxID=392827 RepID=UPI0004042F09|nr:hypothetical protein [Halalkalibacillus halophilus]
MEQREAFETKGAQYIYKAIIVIFVLVGAYFVGQDTLHSDTYVTIVAILIIMLIIIKRL